MSVEKSFLVAKALRGFEPIEDVLKADRAQSQRRIAAGIGAGSAALGLGAAVPAGIYGATQARKGRKAAVGGRTFGRTTAEGAAGALPGAALIAHGMHANNKATFIGGQLVALGGGIAGAGHGAHRAMRNAQNRGDIK